MKNKIKVSIATVLCGLTITSCALKGSVPSGKLDDTTKVSTKIVLNATDNKNSSSNTNKVGNNLNTTTVKTVATNAKISTVPISLPKTQTISTVAVKTAGTPNIATIANSSLSNTKKREGLAGALEGFITTLFKPVLFAFNDEYYKVFGKHIPYIMALRAGGNSLSTPNTTPPSTVAIKTPGETAIETPNNNLTPTPTTDPETVPEIKADVYIKGLNPQADIVQIGDRVIQEITKETIFEIDDVVNPINPNTEVVAGNATDFIKMNINDEATIDVSFYNPTNKNLAVSDPKVIIYSYQYVIAPGTKTPSFIPGGFELGKAKFTDFAKYYETNFEERYVFDKVDEYDNKTTYEIKDTIDGKNQPYSTRYYVNQNGVIIGYVKTLKNLPEPEAPVETTIEPVKQDTTTTTQTEEPVEATPETDEPIEDTSSTNEEGTPETEKPTDESSTTVPTN